MARVSAWTLNYQGDVAREKADLVAARSFCEQSLAAFRATAGRLGNCQRALRSGKSKLRSGEQRRGAPSLRRKHQDVPGVGSQTWHREGTRMSRGKRRGAIECRAIAASGRSRRRPSPAIGRAAHSNRATKAGKGIGIRAPNAWQCRRSDGVDGRLGYAGRASRP